MIKKTLALAFAALISALIVYGLVPPPRQARAQFADQGTWAGAAGGTANALVVTLQNVGTLNDIVGVPIRFIPAANNTGPVTVAITNVLGTTTATALKRPSSIGLAALSLNELWTGEPTSVTYDGTEFVLSSNLDMRGIGDTVETRNSVAPRGTLIEDGSCVSQTTYAALFSVIGTTYGSCGAGLFALPDSRGSMFAALDNQGANGAANRITSLGSGCTATSVGTRCGAEKQTLSTAQLPVTTPTGTVSSSSSANGNNGTVCGVGTGATIGLCGQVGQTITSTFTGNSFGSGQSHPILNPVLLGLRAIKY